MWPRKNPGPDLGGCGCSQASVSWVSPSPARLPKARAPVALKQVPLFQGFCQLQVPDALPLVSALLLGQVGAPAKRLPLGGTLILGQTLTPVLPDVLPPRLQNIFLHGGPDDAPPLPAASSAPCRWPTSTGLLTIPPSSAAHQHQLALPSLGLGPAGHLFRLGVLPGSLLIHILLLWAPTAPGAESKFPLHMVISFPLVCCPLIPGAS